MCRIHRKEQETFCRIHKKNRGQDGFFKENFIEMLVTKFFGEKIC